MKYVCLHLSSYITQTHKYQLPYMHLFDVIVKKERKVFIIEKYFCFENIKMVKVLIDFELKKLNTFTANII